MGFAEFTKEIEHQIDFFSSFQFLEQERHRLRQQLELMEDEYEQRIIELQSDIDTLKSKLVETDSSSRLKDSERSTLGKDGTI